MKLEFARIVNYRQFFGQQDIEFSIFPDLNISVFHGDNGAGKTSLFSAINWCLYERGIEGIGEIVSKRALNEAGEGKEITTSVQISFQHQGKVYVADRYLVVIKTEKGYREKAKGFTLSRYKKSGDLVSEPNPIGTMNSILPSNVRPYFFFDGEKMDDLTKANSEEVKEAIRNMMRLPAIERAKEHLNAIAAEYRKEMARHGSPEIEELTTEEDSLRRKKETMLLRKDELEKEIHLGNEKVEEVERKLRDTHETRELQKQRDNLNRQIQDLENQESELTSDIQRIVNKTYPKYLAGVAEKAIGILDEKRIKGEIPSGVREQLIRDLFEKHTCICGRSFLEGDDAYQHLQALLKRTASSKLENEVSKLGGSLASLSSRFEEDYKNLSVLVKHRAQTQQTCERYYRQLDDIRRQLESSPEQESADLEKLRVKLQSQLQFNIAEQGKIVGQIEGIDKKIAESVSQREKALADEKKVFELSKKEKLAQQAADAVVQIKDQFFENTRIEIERATKEVFSKLAWKQEHFQDLILDKSFRLEVIDRWGTPTRQELSAGERQILSLSFITALSKLSGEEAPLVMDTPFGRLSGNHLRAVAENLPDLTPQLVLFVTDREWDEASRTSLEPRVGSQYRFNFDKDTSCALIEEVEF